MVGSIDIQLGNLPEGVVWLVADQIMVALDGHSRMLGPMVRADQAARTIDVSFEFAATGDPEVDIAKALGFFREALTTAAEAAQAMKPAASIEWLSSRSVRNVEYAVA